MNESEFYSEEAEYTTCKDCPESWSIFGKRVRITPGEYIRIVHGMIKINGVTIMYVPYIVFPIKKGRQTGFLFPKLSFDFKFVNGLTYKQPWYYAINENSDLTLTPASFGKRGYGNEFQYRHVLGNQKWFEVNNMIARDDIYLPTKNDPKDLKLSGDHYSRHLTQYEHHFQFGNNITHHFQYVFTRDLDVVEDYSTFSNDFVNGPDFGISGFIDGKLSFLDVNIEASYLRNQMIPDPREFDRSYVQVMPKISLSTIPVTLVHSSYPFLKNISVGADGSFTRFTQDQLLKIQYIRNADRYIMSPYVNWEILKLGPLNLKTKIEYDVEKYYFPYEGEGRRSFDKRGLIYKSELSFEIDRIYSLAYRETYPVDQVNISESQRALLIKKDKKEQDVVPNESDKNLIQTLPSYEKSFTSDYVTFEQYSYRHSNEYKLIHLYTGNESTEGNSDFYRQINNTNGYGWFDSRDAIRTLEHKLGSAPERREMPIKNTVEFQILNSLIKKTAFGADPYTDQKYLRDNFSYSKIAYFDISQGYQLNTGASDYKDNLTRLYLNTGFNVNRWNFNFSDYYFYQDGKQILNAGATRTFDKGSVGASAAYDPFLNEQNAKGAKVGSVAIVFKPQDIISFNYNYSYDIDYHKSISGRYGFIYTPPNNCWQYDMNYEKNTTKWAIYFNILFNFGTGRWTTFSGKSEK
ncbi:MAG: hypothetical protein U0T83_09395 [Bacteriovoracaceae bacterium]